MACKQLKGWETFNSYGWVCLWESQTQHQLAIKPNGMPSFGILWLAIIWDQTQMASIVGHQMPNLKQPFGCRVWKMQTNKWHAIVWHAIVWIWNHNQIQTPFWETIVGVDQPTIAVWQSDAIKHPNQMPNCWMPIGIRFPNTMFGKWHLTITE